MITLDKLKIYKRYNGDGHMWFRQASQQNKAISGEEWSLIDSLLQDISIVKNGFASKSFLTELNEKLQKNFDCQGTIDFLKAVSE